MGNFSQREECQMACQFIASMFTFGREKACGDSGCVCNCQISALVNRTCQVEDHREFDLFYHLDQGIFLLTNDFLSRG